ncbi:hypothetical protein PUN28_008515 [Cardiocondyla obscurior]|uniref:Secreted protein n=1 Tax=Cardiocondyla obscurior TaxID=286306 RepID=A0AAW2G399_9HYME
MKWTVRLTGIYILSCAICVSELCRVTVRRIRSGKSKRLQPCPRNTRAVAREEKKKKGKKKFEKKRRKKENAVTDSFNSCAFSSPLPRAVHRDTSRRA